MLLCINVMSGILERVPNPTPIFFYYADILDLGVGQWGPFSSSGASVLLLPKPLHNTNSLQWSRFWNHLRRVKRSLKKYFRNKFLICIIL